MTPPDADSAGGQRKPLIEYPTIYQFKVMGRPEGDFAEVVRKLFTRVIGSEVSRDSISEQRSRKGSYVSLTVTVLLHSEEDRQAIYLALHQEKRILYYL